MDCRDVEERGIIERYVARRLPDAEREAFEEHYFACDRCFEMVETANVVGEGFRHRSPWESGRPRRWVPVAAAAGIAALLAGAFLFERSQTPAELVALGALGPEEIPVYVPASLRGESDPAAAYFERGMEAYVRGDYEGAAERLAEAVARDSTKAVWHYYLGASRLASGEPEEAARALEVSADHPILADDSHWLLAKAYLQMENADLALAQLEGLAAGGGPRGDDARVLADRIARLPDR